MDNLKFTGRKGLTLIFRRAIGWRKEKIPLKSIWSSLHTTADRKLFNSFMESMILDYLNSGSMPKRSGSNFIDKVENYSKTA